MLRLNTKDLIDKSKSGNRKAQQQLFSQLSAPMMGVCVRYMKSTEDAEDVLLEGFYKMFKSLKAFTYESEPAFFGWVKRIMVNESLMKLRKNKEIQLLAINEDLDQEVDVSPLQDLEVSDLLKVIRSIPVGYRTVFNLYEIEGYSHQEISEQLGVSIGTSKSQLFKAKKLLREMLEEKNEDYGS
ncbi:RNA polymerase sigma-70 factor, ECF subfamily [Ekhidna lutea]|uniref:RNA polymerase sigma-70 factor, ECF subfamily n=1 Tax=Ekhidna lutea TaxID=447679 RepID=A0A239IX71_EKHLU|nr:RNA polymerase sigma-70 factor, ECF subfamily [Ekhidna lutea]